MQHGQQPVLFYLYKGIVDMTEKTYSLDEIKAIAHPIAERSGIDALYLFGSYARGEATPHSDIDFLVDRSSLIDLLELGGLVSDLENAFDKKVDVLTIQMLSAEFLDSIQAERILIFPCG